MDRRPIGIFDSGVGGLTVTGEIMKNLPREQLIYFGDTARVPYGSKSRETVTKFSRQIVEFLNKFDVKAIVIACNTVSSNSYEELQREFDVKFIEVITPGALSCNRATKNNIAGVIGTAATVGSHAYKNKLMELNPDIVVYEKACPMFVPLAEEGWTEKEITYLTVKEYILPLKEKGIDTLVLGCTHYPLLMGAIEKIAGEAITIINPAHDTAKALETYLSANNMLTDFKEPRPPKFYVSDNTEKFKEICKIAIGCEFEATKIDIEN